jgi:hypothetical protein
MNIDQVKRELDRVQKYMSENNIKERYYNISMFPQTWCNTSGGFETWGGCSMTTENTYVLTNTKPRDKEYVFFAGNFAYELDPMKCTDYYLFELDVKSNNVAGMNMYKERYGV